jgi:hypothetical protein
MNGKKVDCLVPFLSTSLSKHMGLHQLQDYKTTKRGGVNDQGKNEEI